MLPPPEPERGTNWVPIVVTLILIALLGALLWFLAANVLNNDDQQTGVLVTVPNVVGEKRAQAISDLQDNGLAVGTITPVPAADDTQDPGTVLEQDPAAGAEVDRGSKVNLTIVAAPDTVPIPNLEGASVEEAQATLVGLGLEPGGPVEEPSDTVPEGDVTRTDPASGQEVDPGSTVTIFVSTGPEQVAVPEVRCQSFGSAQNELSKAGLNSVDLQRHRGRQPRVPAGQQGGRAGSGAGHPGRPGDDRDPVPGGRGPDDGPTGATP